MRAFDPRRLRTTCSIAGLGLLAACSAPVVESRQGAGDEIYLEAEDLVGDWNRQTNIPGYLGRAFRTSNANPGVASEPLRGSVRLARTGRYSVWVRAYSGGNSNPNDARRGLRVAVANELLDVTHADLEAGWSWQLAGRVELSAEDIAIAVHDADVGFETADALVLTADESIDAEVLERRYRQVEGGVERAWRESGIFDDLTDLSRDHQGVAARLAEIAAEVPDAAEWRARASRLR